MAINRRNVVGIQYTRNETPRASQVPTKNAWKFNITMPSSYSYSNARDLIEAIDHLDTYTPQIITFGDNAALSWIFAYRGDATSGQLSAMTVDSYVGNLLTISNLPSISSTAVLFEPNDLIQIGTHPFPSTSVNQVLRGTGSSITMTMSRPNIISDSVVGDGITAGAGCGFYMFCPNMPTYKLVPGAALYTGSTLISNAMIEWSDNFALYEWVSGS